MKTISFSVVVVISVVIVNLAAWALINRPQEAQQWSGTIKGMSFSPMRRHHNPEQGLFPTEQEIDEDLAALQGVTQAVRSYSVTNGQEHIPRLARKYGLYVSVGAWLAKDPAANKREVDSLIKLTSGSHRNISRALVGNEAIVRGDLTVEELKGYLRRVRQQVWLPVSTAEPWHIWLKHPELAEEVDFIAAHILPYWEGVPLEHAIKHVFRRYDELTKAFPDKPVVIMEVGWPSGGPAFKQAEPSLVNQAQFLRKLFNAVQKTDIVYYVMEAFDQPWKIAIEGSVGAYWGVYDADRQPKFPMHGKVQKLPEWKNWAIISAGLAMIPILLFLYRKKKLRLGGKLFFILIANLAAATVVWTASIGADYYHTPVTTLVWGILISMQAIALLLLLIEGIEVAEVTWWGGGKRHFKPLTPPADFQFPKVSIHIPIHNEPPEMVQQTLDALASLDYQRYEVLVLDNNTLDPETWKPVEQHCNQLGTQFRFFHLEDWPGFKAGALNYGVEQTAEDAEVVAVIDSDYTVEPDWLKCLTPYFSEPNVAFVQAPQDYRDFRQNWFKAMCYWEYAGFFHIGMVQRNEANAIIQHGTMTMIRKSALQEVGQWGEWCICEDTELGLRLLRSQYDSVYVQHSFGRGLMPDSLAAYKTQRYRWVYGAMQILKRHWRSMVPGLSRDLTPSQQFYFVTGWLPWFSDALALLFTAASIVLSLQVITGLSHRELPLAVFIFPVIGLFCFKFLRTMWLYAVRVKCGFLRTLGATVGGLSLTHTVAKATLVGLFTSKCPFMRTPKLEQGHALSAAFHMVWEELVILGLLLSCAYFVATTELTDNTAGELWVLMLLVQAIPYTAAVFTSIINVIPILRQQSLNKDKAKKLEHPAL